MKTPRQLWHEAGGDRARYELLMIDEGHIVKVNAGEYAAAVRERDRISQQLDCGGKGCGTDESKACLRCCRIMLANYAANHGTRCDEEIERLRAKLESSLDTSERVDRQLTAMTAARDTLRTENERLRASHALRDEGYATADYQAVAENIAHDPRWAVRADSQRVARWALSLQQQLVAMTAARDEKLAAANAEVERLRLLAVDIATQRHEKALALISAETERDTLRAQQQVEVAARAVAQTALEAAQTALYDAMHAGHLSREYHDGVVRIVEGALAALRGTTTSRTGDAPAPERSGEKAVPFNATKGTRRLSTILDEIARTADWRTTFPLDRNPSYAADELGAALRVVLPVVRAAVAACETAINSETREAIAARVLLYVAVARMQEEMRKS